MLPVGPTGIRRHSDKQVRPHGLGQLFEKRRCGAREIPADHQLIDKHNGNGERGLLELVQSIVGGRAGGEWAMQTNDKLTTLSGRDQNRRDDSREPRDRYAGISIEGQAVDALAL